MVRKTKKNRVVSFRVDADIYDEIEAAATAKGENVTDLCRDLVVTLVRKNDYFSHGERLIFEELARVRYLVGGGFFMIAEGKLTTASWNTIREEVNKESGELAAKVLQMGRGSNSSGTQKKVS